MSTSDPTWRAWVDVDLAALRRNYETIRRAAPDARILPVVKADAYGLGAQRVVAALEPLEPWGYAVAGPEEGAALRGWGVTRPVVVLFPPHDALSWIAEHALTPALGDVEGVRRWREIAQARGSTLPFHVEIDTGMGRAGFPWDEAERWLPAVLEACDGAIRWEGVFMHLHSADEADAPGAREQWRAFEATCARIPDGQAEWRHAAASAAALRFPEMGADLIRPGLFLYGGGGWPDTAAPEPVVAVRARVLSARDVPEGWTASYGATYRARGRERWATLGIGYADGYPRALSNVGTAAFEGGYAPVIGRVCMDVTVVNVTELEGVRPGSTATLIGGPPDAPTALERVASWAGRISYEILTGLSPRLPRVYRDEEGV
jgi:alanine racemase